MAQVSVVNVIATTAKTAFNSPVSFEIFFEVLQNLPKVLSWKIVYIGKASDPASDQILEEAEMEDLEPG